MSVAMLTGEEQQDLPFEIEAIDSDRRSVSRKLWHGVKQIEGRFN